MTYPSLINLLKQQAFLLVYSRLHSLNYELLLPWFLYICCGILSKRMWCDGITLYPTRYTVKKANYRKSETAYRFQVDSFRDVPTYTKKLGNTVLAAGELITGFPYASEEYNDKFICENDEKNYKVYFENEYGIWTHPMISIFWYALTKKSCIENSS